MEGSKQPKYLEGVGWRYDTEHSMTQRMADHDYQSRCIYMLTLTLADRKQARLGQVRWNDRAVSMGNDVLKSVDSMRNTWNASFEPSALGVQVEAEWYALCREYPQIQIIRLQLMPEHLHVVLFVRERLPKHLGKLVGVVKNRSNKHFWRQLTEQGLLGPKNAEKPPSLFSDNFQDTVLTHEGQLEAMVRYVEQNPYRTLIKRENRDLFKVVSKITVNGVTFAAIGNRWLLDRAVKMQVRCHNNASPANMKLIAAQKKYFLDRGTKGGVVVSPCISAGEKEIARAVLDAGQSLIVILENGFPPMYKPPGKYFEACAKGLLLMLAPWPYHMERRTITRSQCIALNDMAGQICSEPWTPEMEKMLSDTAKL